MTYYITHSGRRINLPHISKNDICISDIAHHLTKICRYGGALGLDQHYSVAQHSILLARYARKENYSVNVQRALLMHDASEAYLGDIVSGLKELLPDYKDIERKVSVLIAEKYGLALAPCVQEVVKELDTRILLDEARAFVPHHYVHFKGQLTNFEPLGVHPLNEEHLVETYDTFLWWCDLLNIGD